MAATYYWDADAGVMGLQNGSGVWTSAVGNENWSLNGSGALQPWVNGGHTAQLGATAGYSNNGAGGAISLGENIRLYRIAKSAATGQYVIEPGAGYTIELVGAGAGFGNNNISVGGELVLNVQLIGTVGLEKTHNGTVILGVDNSYSGGTVIGTTQPSLNNSTLQIGNGGTAGSLGAGDVTFKSNGATSGQSVLAFKRSDEVVLTQELISDVNPNKGILRQAGTGTLVVASENAGFVGVVEVTAGTLQVGDGGTSGSLGGATGVSVSSGAALLFDRADDVSFSAPVTGAGRVVKAGANTLTWAGVGSGFSGGLDLMEGTLALAGDDVLPTAGSVNFLGSSTLDMGAYDQVVGNMTLGDGVTGTVVGTGKLTMGANNVILGTNDLNGTSVLDLSGLAEFEFTGASRTLTVGGRLFSGDTGNTTGTGVLKLAESNVILASAVNVGTIDAGGNAHKNAGELYLGQVNEIRAGNFNIGTANKNSGKVAFDDGVVDGTLVLRGRSTDVDERINISIGRHNSNVTEPEVSIFDVSAGTLDARVGNLTMGSSISGSRSSRARFSMGLGTLDVVNVVLGRREAGSTNANQPYGIFDLDGGEVLARTITFADNIPDTAIGNVQGIFNLQSGKLRVENIQPGAGTNNVTRELNWTAGVIENYDAATDLTMSGVPLKVTGAGERVLNVTVGRRATIHSTILDGVGVSGVAFTKTGDGVMVLLGANAYSGETVVEEGVMVVNNVSGSATGSGAVTVEVGATLAGAGILAPGGSGSIDVSGTFKVGDVDEVVANTLTVDLGSTTGGFALEGVMSFDLFSNVGGDNSGVLSSADRLMLTGASVADLDWSGTLHLGLNSASSLGAIGIGDRWQLVDWTGIVGGVPAPMFGAIDASEIGLAAGLQFVVETDASGLYAVVSEVPEPSRWLLLMLATVAVIGRRKRGAVK